MAEGNRQYSAPQDPGANYEWTESERERASRAIKVTDVEDLTAKIQKHYDGGVHTDPSAYLAQRTLNSSDGLTRDEEILYSQLMKKLQASGKDANADRLAYICQKAAHMVEAKDDEEEGDLDRPDIDSEDEALHKRAKNSMEEELEDEDEDALMQTFKRLTGKNNSSSPSLTPSRNSKAVITSFSPTSYRLAKAEHSQMCVILSTVKGFPGTDERDELVWNAIIKVASSSSLFKITIVDLENARNEQKKGRIIDYVWAAAAQLRGEVKQKARILILSEYALKDKLSEEVHTILEWLLSNGKGVFTFGGLDVSTYSYDKQKPFGHQIL
ncbi:hypothetical protein SERLA73DRAFT_68546 [Serpula lacrymans var. lacrymans S7.3]|uniref:DUF6532 domain-containing protein n=1 Tax=Serpula lacrymans var. lacrymans (strain S7.3) TaxID=936435 RepID=F8PGT3_SERL3|nr:hypothetical protein SERLA73DRAFT_68546 [Serpula lacrymans var. lacrymans S7.3]